MNKKTVAVLAVVVALLIVAYDSVYTVDQTEQAFITQFGKPISIRVLDEAHSYRFDVPFLSLPFTFFQPKLLAGVKKPGLHFKLPFVQKVIKYDRRILTYDERPESFYIKTGERLTVDFYAKWRIVDPLLFYRAVGTIEVGLNRLAKNVKSAIQAELGLQDMTAILSVRRQLIMRRVQQYSDELARQFGIQVIDVRIKRAELPEAIRNAVYERMRRQRKILATQYRASGRRQEVEMKAGARLEQARILAEARRDAKVIMGEADAMAAKTYVDAFARDPDLYRFVRSLQAYVKAFASQTTVVLDGANDFMRYFLPALKPRAK